MTSITLRSDKGSPLTHDEVDDNFSNLNTDLGTTTTALGDYLPLAGGALTGNITITGTVDGRNVATDGTKLDDIEALADVTDTVNVVAALTAGTNVAIASNGTISSTNTTYSVGDGGLTQKNFTTLLNTKLGDIEALADVTDTTNVVAALTAGTNVAIASNGTISSTNTTYSVGDGGLTQKNFTTLLNTKLDNSVVSENAESSAVMQVAKIQTLTALEYFLLSFNTNLDSDTLYLVSE